MASVVGVALLAGVTWRLRRAQQRVFDAVVPGGSAQMAAGETLRAYLQRSHQHRSRLRTTLRLLTVLDVLTTVAAALCIGSALVAYLFGNHHAAIRLDGGGLVLVVVTSLLLGAMQAVGDIMVKRAYQARQRPTQEPVR